MRPKLVQFDRELGIVACYKRLGLGHAKLVARVAALQELHGKAPSTLSCETLNNLVSHAATEVAADILEAERLRGMVSSLLA